MTLGCVPILKAEKLWSVWKALLFIRESLDRTYHFSPQQILYKIHKIGLAEDKTRRIKKTMSDAVEVWKSRCRNVENTEL